MGFSQQESKKIVDACLRNVSKIARGKQAGEDKIKEIELQLVLMNSVLGDTDKKKKKKSKKCKLSDDESTASVEIVEPSK